MASFTTFGPRAIKPRCVLPDGKAITFGGVNVGFDIEWQAERIIDEFDNNSLKTQVLGHRLNLTVSLEFPADGTIDGQIKPGLEMLLQLQMADEFEFTPTGLDPKLRCYTPESVRASRRYRASPDQVRSVVFVGMDLIADPIEAMRLWGTP